MSKECINFRFCKGELMLDNFCLLCFQEKWGTLEFIEKGEECSVCYKKETQLKFPTNCGHSFCINCSRRLLYFFEDRFNICPIKYGCPPCKHKTSCKKRPCCDEDEKVLDEWEKKDYENFILWNYDEFNFINNDISLEVSKKCPICRKVYKQENASE